jgi:predicted nucleic acid-binding protein
MALIVFDTSVWIEDIRHGVLVDLLPATREHYQLRMDVVTAAELRAGCRSKPQRRDVEKYIAPFHRARRLLHPMPGDFERAARALSRLGEGGKSLKRPVGALLDGIIAAVAARSGALLVTANIGDFRLLAEHLPLRVESFDDFRKRIKHP